MTINYKIITTIIFAIISQQTAIASPHDKSDIITSFICETENASILRKKIKLRVQQKKDSLNAFIQVGERSRRIKIKHSVWDGHANGMMTGRAFSFLYRNLYGVIRNAQLTADFRSIGSSPRNGAGYLETINFTQCK